MVSPLLFVTLILCIFSPGSLQDRYNPDRVARSGGRNVHGVDGGDVLPGSESSSDSLEGSGRSLDRTFWSGIMIPKEPQPNLSKHIKLIINNHIKYKHYLRVGILNEVIKFI